MSKLSKGELKTAFALSSVVGLRMFGLFLIMPVFSAYALHLAGATPLLIGLAIGIYGFAQALLQVPVGLLSDRIGRHVTITLGLLVFVIGSVVAAISHGIHGIILGRVLQGMGAVSGASQALAADHSRDDNRSKVMGIIGISIGFAFILAIILSAPLAQLSGLSGLFWLTAVLALIAIGLLWLLVPRPARRTAPDSARPAAVLHMLVRPQLMVLNVSIFMMHTMLTAAFVALPLMLVRNTGITLDHQWELYLPVMLVSVVVMGGVLRRVTSVAGSMRLVLVCALGLGLALCGFGAAGNGHLLLWLSAIVFFSSFNLLEASLPSLVSRLAPAHMRGAALGAYATSQFLGAGVGGVLGGVMLQHISLSAVFVAAAALTLLWLPLLLWGHSRVVAADTALTAA
ncbi:MAG TPA: MFS transporter [Rhodanobacter sp.]|nr:MFS transporter [Rhodanobacter sp.]